MAEGRRARGHVAVCGKPDGLLGSEAKGRESDREERRGKDEEKREAREV